MENHNKKPLIFYPECKSKNNLGRIVLVGLVGNGYIFVGKSQSFTGWKKKRPSSDGGKEWILPKKADQFNKANGRNIALVRSMSALKFSTQCNKISEEKIKRMIDKKYLLTIPIPEGEVTIGKLFVEEISKIYKSIRRPILPKKKKEAKIEETILFIAETH